MSLFVLEETLKTHKHPVPPDVIREVIFLHSARSRDQALLLSLVCKEAYAWMVRVLYRSVSFTTHTELIKFQETISSHPQLAQHIRSLYIGSKEHEKYPGPGHHSREEGNKHDYWPRKLAWSHSTLATVQQLLSHSHNIERLALVNLPPSNWHAVEGCLPARLKTLAVGPSYGLLGLNISHDGLERFYYADTVLQSTELARLASLPSLTDLTWKSPLRFDDVVYAQLKVLLRSISLKTLHVTLFGAEADLLRTYKAEYEDLMHDGRLTIVCDSVYEDSREWIKDFHENWHAVEV